MPTMEFSDNFNRTDSDSLGANWNERSGDADIVSNQLKIISSNDATVTQALTDTDQYCEVVWKAIPANSRPGLMLRCASDYATAYQAQFRSATGDVLFYKRTGGTNNLLLDGTETVTYAPNDVIRFECETVGGDVVLRAYVNGNLLTTYTDTSSPHLTGDYAGIRDSVADAIFDDFEAGILADSAEPAVLLRVNIGQTGTGVRII